MQEEEAVPAPLDTPVYLNAGELLPVEDGARP
jgi:hypothetical protein